MITLKEFLSLQYHKELNPKLWNDHELIPEIREHLLDISYKWIGFANIPVDTVKDIIFTGGNANYNYTNQSDIDIHILVDFSSYVNEKEHMEDYFHDKKTLWSLKHNITVHGYPVELYAQPYNEKLPVNQGSYSLLKNEWITKPVYNESYDFSHDKYIETKVNHYTRLIDKLISNQSSDNSTELKTLKDKLNQMRSEGLQKNGEFAQNNLIFKELRNRGYLGKLKQYLVTKGDQKLSI